MANPSTPGPSALAVRCVSSARDQLGEGPHWDDEAGELLHVDIAAGLLHGWSPASDRRRRLAFDGELSAAIPCAGGGHLLAIGHELRLRRPDGALSTLATVERDDDTRLNDCRCDAQGRVWAGTMSKSRRPGAGALHRVTAGAPIERVLAGTTISNGIGWSPDGATMYFVDSTTQRLDAFDFDADSGAISGRRALARVDPADGLPDGLAVDVEGGVWLCLFGGAAVRRYAPDGTLDVIVPLPVTNPTCPAFGGPDRATLYITSARHRLSAARLAVEPLAGALLALDPGVRGLPLHRFRA